MAKISAHGGLTDKYRHSINIMWLNLNSSFSICTTTFNS